MLCQPLPLRDFAAPKETSIEKRRKRNRDAMRRARVRQHSVVENLKTAVTTMENELQALQTCRGLNSVEANDEDFACESASQLADRTWETSTDFTRYKYVQRWAQRMKILQVLNKETLVVTRENIFPDDQTRFHTFYLLFRVSTKDGFIIGTRSLNLSELGGVDRSLVAEQERNKKVINALYCFIFTRTMARDPQRGGLVEVGCNVKLGGRIGNGDVQYAHTVLMDWEAALARRSSRCGSTPLSHSLRVLRTKEIMSPEPSSSAPPVAKHEPSFAESLSQRCMRGLRRATIASSGPTADAGDHDTQRTMDIDQCSSTSSTASRRPAARGRSLKLTLDETATLRSLNDTLRRDVIAAFEAHVFVHRRQVDLSQWKLMKKRDHLVVLKQRHRPRPGLDGWSSSSVLPTMMCFGSIAGHLDDLMFGFSSRSSLDMKLQGLSTTGTLHDAAVLATIESGTPEHPFQFLGVKWTLQTLSVGAATAVASSSVMNKRELMYLESTGMTTLTTGEPVGYRLLHSVDFKSMTHLGAGAGAVRAKVSICQLFRQKTDGRSIDVFMRGYFDPAGGRVSQLMASTIGADVMLLAPVKALECADIKKLTWVAKQQSRRRRLVAEMLRQTARSDAHAIEEMRAVAQELGGLDHRKSDETEIMSCSICRRDCSGLLGRSTSACMVCTKLVCSRCRVTKRFNFSMGSSSVSPASTSNKSADSASAVSDEVSDDDASDDDIRCKSLAFCVQCVLSAKEQRAVDVALGELAEKGSYRAPVTSLTDASSDRGELATADFTAPLPMRRRATTSSAKVLSMKRFCSDDPSVLMHHPLAGRAKAASTYAMIVEEPDVR
ncbi:hypothetical protein P43SY_000157 [Pythium insidiosum]|uniref:BZIP domain-containing protein n=1 Tax=Pythium insidiosum TaxID=114742 RepID=A0AAD5LD61_PYTIN|nr:hypothetical protein P43SY_000157 [Pythium insidiosum]